MSYKILKGTSLTYRISTDGIVERQLKSGKWRQLSPSIHCGVAIVSLRVPPGVSKSVTVNSLMRDYFMGGPKRGFKVAHKSSSVLDCSLNNLYWATQKQIANKSNFSTRKPVAKIDRNGEVIEVFSSATEAAKKHFMSVSSVTARCRGRIRDPFIGYGYTFKYER